MLFVLFCFLTVSGVDALCEDCTSQSCCPLEVENDPCAEQCGPCDDPGVSVTEILAPRGHEDSDEQGLALDTPSAHLEMDFATGSSCQTPERLDTPALSLHIPTTVLLA